MVLLGYREGRGVVMGPGALMATEVCHSTLPSRPPAVGRVHSHQLLHFWIRDEAMLSLPAAPSQYQA